MIADQAPAPASQDSSPRRLRKRVLLTVSTGVLLASSTWFSGTAVAPLLIEDWQLTPSAAAWLTISVQLGFIAGTLLYSLLNLADIYNARRVFFFSALAGAVFNFLFGGLASSIQMAVPLRFLTGVTLAGIYPVGMKLVASWFRTGLGWRLGVLVGALTMGTASAYLIQGIGGQLSWRPLVGVSSLLAVAGGTAVLLLPDGPHLTRRARFDLSVFWKVFEYRPFRYTAFGYFGHMWELYAFWSLSIFYLREKSPQLSFEVLALSAFGIVAAGSAGCILGGRFSRIFGEVWVARLSLAASATFCLASGWLPELPLIVFLPLLLMWGVVVVADSPQFSALAARLCPPEYTGTALTIQNGVGFAITTISIQLTPWLAGIFGWNWAFVFLAPGPILGFYFMGQLKNEQEIGQTRNEPPPPFNGRAE